MSMIWLVEVATIHLQMELILWNWRYVFVHKVK